MYSQTNIIYVSIEHNVQKFFDLKI